MRVCVAVLPLSLLSHVEAKPLSTSRCPLKSPTTLCTSVAAAAAGLLFSPRGLKLKQVKREESDSVFCGVSALFSRFSPAVYLQPVSALMATLISLLSVSGCSLSSSLSPSSSHVGSQPSLKYSASSLGSHALYGSGRAEASPGGAD